MRPLELWKRFKTWFLDHQGVTALVLIGFALLALLVRLLWPTGIALWEWVVPQPQSMAPLLVNGGFEGGTSRSTIYWTLTGGPYHTEFGEIAPPEGWTAWWREGFLCSGTSDWHTGRPEVRVISTVPDPVRVRSGEQATQFFTYWRCHSGGLLQQVAVESGHHYTFSIYGHAWYSRCSTRPHDSPYDTDCKTRIYWAQDWLSVGIDPAGGIDPMAPSVVWGEPLQIYGRYAGPLIVEHVQAQGASVTVFVRSEASHPLKHVDTYWDDAVLLDVTFRVFLPVVRK